MVLSAIGLVTAAAVGPEWWARTAPPASDLARLDTLLARARDAERAAWFDDEPAVAAAARVRTRARMQELRLRPFRNYASVADSAATAVAALEGALGRTDAARRADSDRAARTLESAHRALTRVSAAAARVPLDERVRQELATARARLAESDRFADLGRLDAATASARQAEAAAGRVRAGILERIARFADPGEVARWSGWVDEVVRESRTRGTAAVVVDKDRRRLVLYHAGRRVAEHPVDLGPASVEPKLRQGDRATPEGRYRVVQRKDLGASRYRRALLLDYPNREDRDRFARAREDGRVPRNAAPGGLIEIHGAGGRGEDWTDGCVALADAPMDALFARVPVGTPVVIVGGDGTGPWAELARRLLDDAP